MFAFRIIAASLFVASTVHAQTTTEPSVEEYDEKFAAADGDSDNSLNQTEVELVVLDILNLETSLHITNLLDAFKDSGETPDEIAASIIEKFDQDGDGELNEEEADEFLSMDIGLDEPLPPTTDKDAQEVFNAADNNTNKLLEKEELVPLFENYLSLAEEFNLWPVLAMLPNKTAEEMVDIVVKEHDTDKDKALSFAEFAPFFKTIMPYFEEQTDFNLKNEMSTLFDYNADGFRDKDELLDAVHSMVIFTQEYGLDAVEDKMEAALAHYALNTYDKDGDGKLDSTEWDNMLTAFAT